MLPVPPLPPIEAAHKGLAVASPPTLPAGPFIHAFAPFFPRIAGSFGSVGPTESTGVAPFSPAIPFPATSSQRLSVTVAPSTINAIDDPPAFVASAARTSTSSIRISPAPFTIVKGTVSALP